MKGKMNEMYRYFILSNFFSLFNDLVFIFMIPSKYHIIIRLFLKFDIILEYFVEYKIQIMYSIKIYFITLNRKYYMYI